MTFNEIFCILALFLFYGTPAKSELFDQVGWKQNLTTDWGWDSVCWFNWFYASVGNRHFRKNCWAVRALSLVFRVNRFLELRARLLVFVYTTRLRDWFWEHSELGFGRGSPSLDNSARMVPWVWPGVSSTTAKAALKRTRDVPSSSSFDGSRSHRMKNKERVRSIFIEKVVTECSSQSKNWRIWRISKNGIHL